MVKNECTAIVGHSGSGKTTLIQHFTGLLKPSCGEICVDGLNIWSSKYKLAQLRRRIGIVFQFPETQLFEATVEKDVGFGPKNLGLEEEEIQNRVQKALETVELDPSVFAERSPFNLSEGEKRRVAIAGVLAMDSEMIVMDEPVAGLDPKGIELMKSIFRTLVQSGKSVVVITHNMDFVAEICSRVIVISNGTILYDGFPRQLFSNEEIMQKSGLEVPSFILALKEFSNIIPPELADAITIPELSQRLRNLN